MSQYEAIAISMISMVTDKYPRLIPSNTVLLLFFFETANKIATRKKLDFRGGGRYNFLLSEQIMDDLSGILQVRLPMEIAMFLRNRTFLKLISLKHVWNRSHSLL